MSALPDSFKELPDPVLATFVGALYGTIELGPSEKRRILVPVKGNSHHVL
jgi:hypothetical protein